MKRMKKTLFILTVLSLSLSGLFCLDETMLFAAEKAQAEQSGEGSVVVQKDRGLIDWSKNYIEATGMAVAPTNMKGAQAQAMARRGAIVDLQRNLLEFLVGVQVDSRTTMNDFMAEDRVRSEVHGMIQNIELLEGKWDGESYTVVGRVKLPQLLICVAPSLPAPTAKPASAPQKSAGRYTGLVIDARHLGIVPSLSFAVTDERGNSVYGIRFADPKFLAQSGLATYYNNLNIAKGELRVATNPISAKAIRVSDDGTIVIPNSDAAKVAGSSYDFRKECKVIIVCN